MTKYIQHIPHAIAVSILAFVATYASSHPSYGYALWPCLMGWATYFLVGAKPQSGLRGLANLAWGGLIAVGALYANSTFNASAGEYAYPLAISLGCFVMIMMERAKYVNLVPFQFVGFASFLALSYEGNFLNVVKMTGLYAIGMVFGYATYYARNQVSKFMGTTSPWTTYRKKMASVAAGEQGKKAA